ncbi:tyrosine-protein kinase family protein [Chloroflexota bacterium]
MKQLVCLHAALAGTGKTHIIANLAVQLMLRGYHVGVLDTDMINPGQHTLFNLPRQTIRQTISDYVCDKATLEACLYELTPQLQETVPEIADGGGTLHLIPASPAPRQRNRIISDGYAINLLIDAMHKLIDDHKFDFLLVDTAPGYEHKKLLTACTANLLLVTATPDQQHLAHTAFLMDKIRRVHEPSMALVMNRTQSDVLHPTECDERYGLAVAACLPESYPLNALNSGSLFTLVQPDHIWSKKIAQLADFVIEAD